MEKMKRGEEASAESAFLKVQKKGIKYLMGIDHRYDHRYCYYYKGRNSEQIGKTTSKKKAVGDKNIMMTTAHGQNQGIQKKKRMVG